MKEANNHHAHQQYCQKQSQNESTSQKAPYPFSFGKTLNSVLKSSRKIIFRVCEAANVKKQIKILQVYSNIQHRQNLTNEDRKEFESNCTTTDHDRFYKERSRISHRQSKCKHVRRTQSQNEFESYTSCTDTNKMYMFRGRSMSSEYENSESDISEKSPIVSSWSLAKLLLGKGQNVHEIAKETSPQRCNAKYQYTAIIDSKNTVSSNKETTSVHTARGKAYETCSEWLKSTGGRYEIFGHLDDIGSRSNRNWFLLNDCTIKTERLMTLLPLPSNCVAFEELPSSECSRNVFMELFGTLQHPYIYPILDLEFFEIGSRSFACLVMPFNPKGSLKDLIYKSQWNEPWGHKYVRKPSGLPLSQIQRLGRQILESLLYLRGRGIFHGHLHAGNVILQNGVARLSGLENQFLGLNSHVNSVLWATSMTNIESVDIICFGHLLFEMCAGYELSTPTPTKLHLQFDLERYPQVAEVLQMIFGTPDFYPSLENIVLCDLFRNIDLREMRGNFIPSFKQSLSTPTISLLNAVRKRYTVANGSCSEGNSPCTPPPSPRNRYEHEENVHFKGESEQQLDEIVVTKIDSEVSPIHFCDFLEASTSSSISLRIQPSIDSENTLIRISSFDDFVPKSNVIQKQSSTSQTLDPSSACKTSKTRRTEYSMRGIQLDCSNPSQDSALGSMTDGEFSRASSFKMSSFQSVSSPIDEGVEDVLEDKLPIEKDAKTINSESSNTSICQKTLDNFTQSLNDLNVPVTSSVSNSINTFDIKETCIYLDLPKLMVNDDNYIYASSPIRKCKTNNISSQKYRVSSFEDMTSSSNMLRNVCKKPFRSFEEEQRIETAFTPITLSKSSKLNMENGIESPTTPTQSRMHQITTPSMTGKERSILWKDSFLKCNKNNVTIKPNESLCENEEDTIKMNVHRKKLSSILSERSEQAIQGWCYVSGDDEDDVSFENSTSDTTSGKNQASHITRNDRLSFSLAKFKQNAIVESVALDTLSEGNLQGNNNHSTNSSTSSNDESNFFNTTITSTTNDECYSEEECSSLTESLLKTPSIEDVRKFVKSFDSEDGSHGSTGSGEAVPLLGIEMHSMSSSTEPE